MGFHRSPPKSSKPRPDNPPDLNIDYCVDFDLWLQRDTWSIYHAILLLLEINPRKDELFLADNTQEEKIQQFKDIIGTAASCENLSLTVESNTEVDKNGNFIRYATVKPARFIHWAAKKYDIPEALLSLVKPGHNEQKTISIPEQRTQKVISLIEEMIEAGLFNIADYRWPRINIWRKAIEVASHLFPNNLDDQREGKFSKAYNEARRRLIPKE